MRYYRAVMLLICLWLTACAGTRPTPPENPLALPEGFIGTWDYDPAGNILYVVRPDGVIETRNKATNEIENRTEYKVVHIEDSRSAYILTQDSIDEPKNASYQYQHLYIHLYHDRKKPPSIKWTYSCFTDKAEWLKPRSEQEKRILDHDQYDCDVTTYWSSTGPYERYHH